VHSKSIRSEGEENPYDEDKEATQEGAPPLEKSKMLLGFCRPLKRETTERYFYILEEWKGPCRTG